MAKTGQSGECGMLGRGIMWSPSLCCRVLDHLIRRIMPESVNFISSRVSCSVGLKVVDEVATKLDLRKNEMNATVNRAQMPAWCGEVRSRCWRKESSMAGVMGCF